MKKLITATAAAILLSGCASQVEHRRQLMAEVESTRPVCKADKECTLMWSAARRWVLENSSMKIQHITDDFIETYNPTGGSPRIGVRVVKDPLPDGSHKISVRVWCDNIFGCNPDALGAAVHFNRTVASAGAQAGQ